MASSRKIDASFFENRWVDELVANGESHYVLLWLFLIITCRNLAGIFEVNPRLWNFKLNPPSPYKGEDVFVKFGKRIRRIEGHPDKGIIVGFCDFQRNFGTNSKQWQWIVADLEKVGLTHEKLQEMDKDVVQPELELGVYPPITKATPKSKEREKRLIIPPKVEWVAEYCSTRNNGIDANYFIDFYNSKGWKVGKEKMIDWQAAVRTWEKKDKKDKPVGGSVTPQSNLQSMLRRKF